MPLVASSAFCYLAAMSTLCQIVDRRALPPQYCVDAFTSAFSGWRVRHSSLVSKKKRTLLDYRREDDYCGRENNSSSAQIIGAIWGSTNIDSIREQLLLFERTRTTIFSGNETGITPDPHVFSVALRRFTQLLGRNQSKEKESGSFEHELLPRILDIIETSVKASDTDLCFNILTDTLVSCSFLLKNDSCATIHALEQRLDSLARFIWTERLQKSVKELVSNSSPGRMTDCVQASLSLQFIMNDEFMPLFEALCERMVQGDVLSRLTPFQLTGTLVSFSRDGKKQVLCRRSSSKLITAFTRRLRKQSIRSRMNTFMLLRTIASTSRLARVLSSAQNQGDDVMNANSKLLIVELNTATYTLIKEVLKDNASEKMRPLVASEAITLLGAVNLLDLDTTKDPIVLRLHGRLWQDTDSIIETASLRQTALLSKAFLHPNNTKAVSLSRQVGDKLTTEFTAMKHNNSPQLEPWIVSSLVRYAVLMCHQRLEPSVLKVYQTFVRQCILEPSFLNQSNAAQISNFCWFMHSTQWNDEAVVLALAHRTLETDLQSTCTPKIACRLLYMFTGIFENENENAQIMADAKATKVVADRSKDLLSQLFDCLGEHLLSTTNLTARELSSAIYAYAKASYVQDIGIFDHLVDLLASRMEEATTRQLAQSLWACGKMVGFEGQPDEVDTSPVPPYYSAAFQLAQHLSCNADLMTTKDIAQSLWSLGRLKISDEDIVTPMIYRAQKMAKAMNTQEVSNILWAMSRIRSNEYKTVFVLTRRFALTGSTANANSQEAANILYSLGRLNIRDEDIFRNLSHVIMKQIDETSAQAVANVLWAHRAVHLEPPQELLNRWANEKLGIVPVQPKDG